MAKLRLAIVEDEGLLRELLERVLGTLEGFEVVGAFGDADAAERAFPGLNVDVVLMDIHLGTGRTGIQLGLALRRQLPRLGIVLLSNQRDPAYLSAIPRSQAVGWSFLHKSSVADLGTVTRAIRGAADGLVVLDARVAHQLVNGRRPVDELTERSRSVLELVAQGFSNTMIAERLCLAEKSVENALTALYRQLAIDTSDSGVNARVQATLHYLRAV